MRLGRATPFVLAGTASVSSSFVGQRAPAPATLSIFGTVVFDSSGVPLAGVRVTVEGDSALGTYSDSAGRYQIDSLRHARYFLRAEAIGYIPERREVRAWCTELGADDRGRITFPVRCSADRERLNFRMRPERHH